MINSYLSRSCILFSFSYLKQVPWKLSVLKYSVTKLKTMDPVKSLKELGYAFNAEGKLRKLNETGEPGDEPFRFNISDKHQECQAHYEEIGNAVTQYVYRLLETQENLTRLPVPVEGSPSTFIYASKSYDEKDTLMVLIHGSGVVRAGQWARSLIINESIDMGTQIPYVKKAVSKGYGVLIMNTNDNFTDEGEDIQGSETPEIHGTYVWDNYISKTNASNILIVAHSYGGVVTVNLADKLKDDFKKRVKAVAFTDSVHGFASGNVSQYLRQIGKNWISSAEPLDTPINTPEFDIPRVSAGHTKHEMTSYFSMESVFKFFDEKLSKK